MITGKQVRLLRQVRNIKQGQIARALQITQQRYSVLENKQEPLPADKASLILATLKLTVEEAGRILNTINPLPDKQL